MFIIIFIFKCINKKNGKEDNNKRRTTKESCESIQ